MAKKGDWVRLHIVALRPEERAPQVPEDTKSVPLEMFIKGKLNCDGEIGEEVEVTTRTGRQVKGTLLEVNPSYNHSFGNFIPELQEVEDTVKELVFGGNHE